MSPARRILFAASLVAALLGLIDTEYVFRTPTVRIQVQFSSFWLIASIAGLVFLLVLELVDRIRVRDELEVARQLQQALLPRQAPEVPGYLFAHSCRTANEVGGDYYDFQPLADKRLVVVVGDASGHGMAAGLLMAIANATLMTALEIDPDPVKVLSLLNRILCRNGDRRAFMTLFYGLLHPPTGPWTMRAPAIPFRFSGVGAARSKSWAWGASPWVSGRNWTSGARR